MNIRVLPSEQSAARRVLMVGNYHGFNYELRYAEGEMFEHLYFSLSAGDRFRFSDSHFGYWVKSHVIRGDYLLALVPLTAKQMSLDDEEVEELKKRRNGFLLKSGFVGNWALNGRESRAGIWLGNVDVLHRTFRESSHPPPPIHYCESLAPWDFKPEACAGDMTTYSIAYRSTSSPPILGVQLTHNANRQQVADHIRRLIGPRLPGVGPPPLSRPRRHT